MREHQDGWRGAGTGISAAWREPLIARLGPADRATARFALLTADSSHQVGDGAIAEFRQHEPGDEAPMEVAGWAAFKVTRRVGARRRTAAHRTPGDARFRYR
ncbi:MULTISPECIES: hypothetical protein [unclassified Micromonospora]|uniref:hypothetical protein n=1 Tax=unclassified Micromonospora TaxID=2617518 RepID=UPI003A880E60